MEASIPYPVMGGLVVFAIFVGLVAMAIHWWSRR